MFENISKAKMKIWKYLRNNQKSYDDALNQLEYRFRLSQNSLSILKFHHVKETRMMLVAFWRRLVKIVVVFQHKRQRNKSFSRFLDNLKTPTRTVQALHYSMRMNYSYASDCLSKTFAK